MIGKTSANNSEPMHEDIYIPKDLDDCIVQLKMLFSPEVIEEMRSSPEVDMNQYHFGLGLCMRNTWGLWIGSRLAKWFNTHGIEHPDDMSGIILTSFWRNINNKPIKLEEQIKYYRDYWQSMQK